MIKGESNIQSFESSLRSQNDNTLANLYLEFNAHQKSTDLSGALIDVSMLPHNGSGVLISMHTSTKLM